MSHRGQVLANLPLQSQVSCRVSMGRGWLTPAWPWLNWGHYHGGGMGVGSEQEASEEEWGQMWGEVPKGERI